MDRRGFLKSILAAGVAPAFVGSGILMPVRKLWTPEEPAWGYVLATGTPNITASWVRIYFTGADGKMWEHNFDPPLTTKAGESVTVQVPNGARIVQISQTWNP